MMLLLMGAMFMLSCSLMASSLMYATNFGVAPPTKSSSVSGAATTSSQVSAAPSMPYDVPEGIKTDCPPGKRGIIGWEHEIRSGKSYMWCGHDNGRGSGIAHIGNDKLSYLSVPPGMKVTVYEHNDMGGLSKVFAQGEWDLRQHRFDIPPSARATTRSPVSAMGATRVNDPYKLEDRASSLKIEGVPVDASTPATSSSFWNMNR
jgi:hypothetical protein